MQCSLCLQQRELRASHIIPEFLYKQLYDEKHRFWVVSVREDERNELKQKGEREDLLCDECEERFSRYERYASLVLGGGLPLTVQRKGRLIFLGGIDYAKFKLFQMSILWRASVSSLALFERVTLGPHEEILRRQLLSDDPGDPIAYGVIMWGITLAPGETPGVIMQPSKVRVEGFITYKFVFGGMMWVYFVSARNPGYPHSLFMLSREGSVVVQVRGIEEMHDLRKFMETAQKNGKLPE
jgi:hypothetical protein